MSLIKRPSRQGAYLELVKQALFEVEELRMAAEFDEEYMGDVLSFIPGLEKPLREMESALRDGSYEFGADDLPFMPIVERQPDVMLPFKTLLRQINDTHRQGLRGEGEE